MDPPVAHREEHENDVDRFCPHQERQLGGVGAEEAVKSPEDEHPEGVRKRIGEETLHPGPPVVKNVLGELSTEVVAEEAAHHREPNDEEVYDVV